MARSQEARVLLACLALALLVLTVLSTNVARLGSVIAREIYRAQIDYLQEAGSGSLAEHNALLLGQCLRREMLKATHAGFVHADTWAVAARVRALPQCAQSLPPLPAPPLITRPRARLLVVHQAPLRVDSVHTQLAGATAPISRQHAGRTD